MTAGRRPVQTGDTDQRKRQTCLSARCLDPFFVRSSLPTAVIFASNADQDLISIPSSSGQVFQGYPDFLLVYQVVTYVFSITSSFHLASHLLFAVVVEFD